MGRSNFRQIWTSNIKFGRFGKNPYLCIKINFMTYRTEKRTYPTINKQGKKSTMKVGYTLYFNGDVLVDRKSVV